MKHILALLILLPLGGMAQFVDDFSDGDLTSNPVWAGDVSKFTVNSSFQLQSNGPAVSDTAILYRPFNPDYNDTIEWELYWELDFDPSNNNNGRIYLLASDLDLANSDSAFYLRIGENGSDDRIELYIEDGGGSTALITGSSNVSQSPAIRVYVIRFPFGGWQLWADVTGGENFALEGSTVYNGLQPTGYFGLFCKYTSSNSDNFIFDDIQVNEFIVDTIPPTVESVVATSNSSVLVTFSEAVDLVTAQTASNYSVDGGIGQANTAILQSDSSSVALTFINSFSSGNSYNLSVSNVNDLEGNSVSGPPTSFLYLDFISPGYRDLVINEVMADPEPPVAIQWPEFVEIFNTSSGYINLTNLTLSDLASTGSPVSAAYLGPGEYATLCAQSNVAVFDGLPNVIGLSSLPSLNNTGDVITLMIDSMVIDVLSYTESWYNDGTKANGGWTLEQINPYTPCTGRSNWSACEDFNGATPSQQNSIYSDAPDTIPPMLIEVELTDPSTVHLTFDQGLDSLSVFTGTYTLTPNIGIASIGSVSPYDEVYLNLSSGLNEGQAYTLDVSGPKDCIGNTMADTSLALGLGATPDPYDLIINEIYAIPDEGSALPPFEFIELYNRSDKLISTDGLRVADRGASSYLFVDLIAPGEFVIVCDNSHVSHFDPFGKVIEVSSMPSLNNSDDDVFLYADDVLIDVVPYQNSWFNSDEKSDGGWTLERINPNDLCGLKSNWTACSSATQGTPGSENSVLALAEHPGPALLDAKITGLQTIELTLRSRMDTLIPHEGNIDNTSFAHRFGLLESSFSVALDASLSRGNTIRISLDTLRDCVNEERYNAEVEVYLHNLNEIVINEILFNPRDGGSDFVELANSADRAISMAGWSFGYYDSNDSLRFNAFDYDSLQINASGYLAFHENKSSIISNYPFTVEANLRKTDLPSYSNSEGEVLLFDQLGALMDSVHYDEEQHFALIKDPDGVSLERLSASRPSDDPGNWHSASSTENYATPGYKNSQEYSSENAAPEVSLSAEFISPDNDGYQDVVNIDFNFPEAGYSMTIEVYTENGARIRTIASNELIGASGTFTWDGTTDEGGKANVGIHLILVDAFNLKNQRSRFKLPVIVAAHLR